MKKRFAALGLAVTLLASSLGACSSPSGAGGGSSAPAQGQQTQASGNETAGAGGSQPSGEKKIFNWSSTNSASNISPFEGNTEIIDYIHANLYRYVANEARDAAVLAPDLAAKEPYTEDGYTWIIELNPEAKWANGDPINADTFMYSWKMALDPKISYATPSGLAKNFIEVAGA